MKDIIEKYALSNSYQYGKANPKAVMNKVIGTLGSDRKKVSLKDLNSQVIKIVDSVNKLKKAEKEKRLRKIWPEYFGPKEVKKKVLPDLPGAVMGKVRVRLAPSPSGPFHIGHVYPLLLNKLYKDKYKGKLILRLEDTNPANILPSAYKQIPENAKWATQNGVDEIHIQSERMKIYYDYAKELIDSGFAYVCTCSQEKFKEYSSKKAPCPCRQMRPKEHARRWKDMFLRYMPGQAVLRVKTDVEHKNPAIREWVAFRIVDMRHPKQGKKYKVWPMMNFSVAVDDHELKLTHVIRGKDHEANTEKQRYIYKYFRWRPPEFIHIGRINFKGMKLSTTQFKQEINSKAYTGWDDIRLPTLFALQRRGIQPGALERMVKEIGPTKSDKTVSYEDFMKTIYSFNKEILDPTSNRYYFVPEPVRIKISGAPDKKTVELKLHPDIDSHSREVKVTKVLKIPKKDYQANKGKDIRLKGLYNVTLGRRAILNVIASKFSGGLIKQNMPKVQWVSGAGVKTEVLMSDGKKVSGVSEQAVGDLKVGDIVQFERFGFVRLDKKDSKKLTFVYVHS